MTKTATKSDLVHMSCRATGGKAKKLADPAAKDLLKQVPKWKKSGQAISRTFNFKNYYETMAFVNAIAWIAHGEDHHPDLAVGYNTCAATYSTHSAGGLTENDFICAAKVDALLDGGG